MMTQVLITVVVLSLWLQVHCQDVIQHPEISWSYLKKTAEMNCSHTKDMTHSQMYWYRQRPGETMTLIVYTAVGVQPDYGRAPETKYSAKKEKAESGALTVNDLQPEDSGVYFCAVRRQGNNANEAYFGKGTKLTVLDPDKEPNPPQVKVLEPSAKECRNKKKTLVCVASKFYPDHVSVYWKINENRTDGKTDNNALKKDDGSYTITSRLRVADKDWHTPDKKFTCIVSFYDGKETKDYSDSVSGVEAPAAGREITRERYLRLTNAAKLSYGVFIAKSCIYGAFVAFLVWKLQGSTGKQSN